MAEIKYGSNGGQNDTQIFTGLHKFTEWVKAA